MLKFIQVRKFTPSSTFAVLLAFVATLHTSPGIVNAEAGIEESRLHQLGWGVGVGYPQFREDILTNLRWLGIRPEIGAEYRYNGRSNHHRAFFGLSWSSLWNRYGDWGQAHMLDIGYTYLAKLSTDDRIGEFWLGPTLRYIIDDQHYESWISSHLFWLTTLDLGPSGAWHTRLGNKHDIWVELQFPLLAFASRPAEDRYYSNDLLRDAGVAGVWEDFVVWPNEKMRFVSLNEYISIRLRASYLYAITTGIEIGGYYEFGYRTFSQPERFQHLDQSLGFRLVHNL